MPSRAFSQAHPQQSHQSSYTQAIATQGRAAIDQRRQAASYGQTGQAQALKDLYGQIAVTGTGSSAHPGDTSQYQQWQEKQGFRQPAQQISYGQTPEGKYSGFKNASDLNRAILGRAELSREHDMQQAAQLKDTLGSQYDQLGQTVDTNMLGAGAALRDSRNRAPAAANVLGQRLGDYGNQMDAWYAKQGEPLVQGMETANQIAATPTREYGMRAGAAYGVDPNIVAGMFPMAGQIKDASDQRDLESLRQTGLPYSEQQGVLHQLDQQGAQAQTQASADQKVQMADDIYGATSFDGDQLAQTVDAPIEAVHQVVTNPGYVSYVGTVENAKAAAEADATGTPDEIAASVQAAIDNAIQAAMDDVGTVDPAGAEVLGRILHAQYGG